jgi:hypothetical protein
MARNADPAWWQLTLRYDESARQQLGIKYERHLGALRLHEAAGVAAVPR